MSGVDYKFTTTALDPWFVGLDKIRKELEDFNFVTTNTSSKYPPHNLINLGDGKYVIELAVAGFSQDEIDIELVQNDLTIKGTKKVKNSAEDIKFLYKGISARTFTRNFLLVDDIEVSNVTLKDGMLSVFLTRVIPPEKMPRKIPINSETEDTPQLLTE